MTVGIGSVRGPLAGPYIYAIRTRNLLYVGETQGHPVMRWGAHLQVQGSFRAALARHGDPEVDYLSDIAFYGFHCRRLMQDFPEAQHKAASQAVEHHLHTVIAARPSEVGAPVRLISDTVKTAPRRFRGWVSAEAVGAMILTSLRECLAIEYPNSDFSVS